MAPFHTSDRSPYQAVIPAPGFALGLRCTDDVIIAIEWLAPHPAIPAIIPLAQAAEQQLHAWLKDSTAHLNLPLAPSGTVFQRRVWEQIASIPHGETRTYGSIAKILQSSPRAVGGACGANPYPIIIPCHRVIAQNGHLGGFDRSQDNLHLGIKRWLLHHEKQS